MKKELLIQIFGRVQGVNFRRRFLKLATDLKLTGFVENLEDGSVYAVAQGEENKLEELLLKTHKFPFPVKITGMKYEWKEKLSFDYKSFTIKKDESFILDEAHSFINLGKNLLQQESVNIPKHVVIIPDGNRRWAREKGWKAYVGHRKAAQIDRLVALFKECKDYGVEYLTFWAFSTENWKREKSEVEQIFNILTSSSAKLKNLLTKEQIRFRHLGRKDRLPEDVLKVLSELEELSQDFNKLNFQFCMDYGGRNSIVEAVKKLVHAGENEIDEETISKYLDSNELPDPDLIIRTSGEQRLSGIMPYESVYAELYFTKLHFPDFDAEQFRMALLDYSARKRRFGGTNDKDLANLKEEELIDPDEIKDDLKKDSKASLNI